MAGIVTASSSATAPAETAGNVLVSGSYGGVYNAWHGLRKGARALILNDAGVGRNNAGISGLGWLASLGVAAATADCRTCHIGDGEHMLEHGRISYVNAAAIGLGCAIGQSVRACAELLRSAPRPSIVVPDIAGGKRFVLANPECGRLVLGLDAAPLLASGDAGTIAITGSHAALFRGQPDNVIAVALFAAFFNDAGVGLDNAGIARLADLDDRMIAATVSAESAEIGNARDAYEHGVISYVNRPATQAGVAPGMKLSDVVERLSRL